MCIFQIKHFLCPFLAILNEPSNVYYIYLCIMSVVIHVHVYIIFVGLVVRFGVV